jgi:hypothetical protein
MDHDLDPSLQIVLTKDGLRRTFVITPSPIFDGQWLVVDSAQSRGRVVDVTGALPARQQFDATIRELIVRGWMPA